MVGEGENTFLPEVSVVQFKSEADTHQMLFDRAQEFLDEGDVVRATVLTMSMLIPNRYPRGEREQANFGNFHRDSLRDMALPMGDVEVEGNVHEKVGLAPVRKQGSTELRDDAWAREVTGDNATATSRLRAKLRNTRERQFLMELADRWVEVSQKEPLLLADEGGDYRRKLRNHEGGVEGLVKFARHLTHYLQTNVAGNFVGGEPTIHDFSENGMHSTLSVPELTMAVAALRFVPTLVREASTYDRNSLALTKMATGEQIDRRLVGLLENSHLDVVSTLNLAEAMATAFRMDLRHPASDPLVTEGGKRILPIPGSREVNQIVRLAANTCLDSVRKAQFYEKGEDSETVDLILQADRLGREFSKLEEDSLVLDGQSTLRSRIWQSASARLGAELVKSFYPRSQNGVSKFDYGRFEDVKALLASDKLTDQTEQWLIGRISRDALLLDNVAIHLTRVVTQDLDETDTAKRTEMDVVGERVRAEIRSMEDMGLTENAIDRVAYGEAGIVARSLGLVTERIFEKGLPANPEDWIVEVFDQALGKFEWDVLTIFPGLDIGKNLQRVSGMQGYGESLAELKSVMGTYVGIESMANKVSTVTWISRPMQLLDRSERILTLDKRRKEWRTTHPAGELGKTVDEVYPPTQQLMKEVGNEWINTMLERAREVSKLRENEPKILPYDVVGEMTIGLRDLEGLGFRREQLTAMLRDNYNGMINDFSLLEIAFTDTMLDGSRATLEATLKEASQFAEIMRMTDGDFANGNFDSEGANRVMSVLWMINGGARRIIEKNGMTPEAYGDWYARMTTEVRKLMKESIFIDTVFHDIPSPEQYQTSA